MPISSEQLAQIINGRAKQLCQNEAKQMPKSNSQNVVNESAHYDYDTYMRQGGDENEDLFEQSNTYTQTSNMDSYSDNSVQNSKLPDKIKESMMKTRISSGQPELSVLDQIGVKQEKKRNITENKTQYTQTNGQIDYSIIKAIVKECISEYFDNKQTLNESVGTLKSIGLSAGKIRIIDNKGNIFSASLEKTGNVNNKR